MISISYRREDSQPVAGRLYDRLQARFGKQNVFMDFDSIPPGVDFREQIKRTIERSNLVIAVIGPRWLGEHADSSRRIDDPTDFVRLEIKYALEKGIPVIPLLVDNTLMPKPEELPPELEALAFRNALPLDSGIDFHTHAERLINGICGLVDVSKIQDGPVSDAAQTRPSAAANPVIPASLPRRSKILVWSAIALIVAVGAGWFIATNHREKIDKTQQTVAIQEPASAGIAQPVQTLTIAPQPTAAPTESSQASDATQHAQPGASEAPQPIESIVGPSHLIRPKTISIENGTVSINGSVVQNVESVLGKPERIESGRSSGAEIDIWDSIGLRVYPNEAGKPYLQLDVFLSDENNVNNCPQKTYEGELLVSGFSVSSTTNIKALNASLGSKALMRTEGKDYPTYSGQHGAAGIEILCDAKGVIHTVSVLPGGLPKSELPETPAQRSAKAEIAKFLDRVKKGDLRAAYQHFQHTTSDPVGFTLEGFTSFVHQNEAFSQIKSYRVVTVTNDSWEMVFWGRVEVTCKDGRQREATVEMLRGAKSFEIDHIEGANHGFPRDDYAVQPSKQVEPTSSITKDMVREFVKKFVSANQLSPPDAVLALYASKVQYRGEGERDQDYIRKDLEKDHKRWPIRQDNIEGAIEVNEKAAEYGASFTLKVYVESPERHEWIKGQFAVVLSVTAVEGEPKISLIKETALHRETGKFLSDQGSNKTSPTPGVLPPQTPSPSSKGGKIFAGNWEGTLQKPGYKNLQPMQIVINEGETEVNGQKGWIQTGPRTLKRTITPQAYYSVTINKDGKTGTYLQDLAAGTVHVTNRWALKKIR